jgi:hypothetical protein
MSSVVSFFLGVGTGPAPFISGRQAPGDTCLFFGDDRRAGYARVFVELERRKVPASRLHLFAWREHAGLNELVTQ